MFGEVESVPFEPKAPPPSPEPKPRPKRILPWKIDVYPPAPPPSPRSVMSALLHATPYKNPKRLPKSFRVMRTSFARDGVADPRAVRKAIAWCKSRRKRRDEATLHFDEVWDELRGVARECKKSSNDLDAARKHYNSFATTMAFVFEPFLEDNEDGIDVHDFGGPLSDYGHGAVEAAWDGKSPYDDGYESSSEA